MAAEEDVEGAEGVTVAEGTWEALEPLEEAKAVSARDRRHRTSTPHNQIFSKVHGEDEK